MDRTTKTTDGPSRASAPGNKCEHSEGVYIVREDGGRCHARCLACGAVGPSREDFVAALRGLQAEAG